MKSSKGQRNGHRGDRPYQGGTSSARPQVVEMRYTPPAVAPARWPSISVCAIVKNEAENLEACLLPLKDLASEIIVVDTGSTDDTVRIAQEMGARVLHSHWVDDFAAARNESIRDASSQWVFWVDADDRLSASSLAQLKAAAASGKADVYSCLVSSVRDSGGVDVTEHIRLFKNGLGIRFSGAVHESILPDVVRLGLKFAHTEIALEHIGYHDAGADSPKLTRNLRIIERELQSRPGDPQLIYYRGQTLASMGDGVGMIVDMELYLSLTRPSRQFDTQRFWARYSPIRIYENRGQKDELRKALAAAMEEFPGHAALLRVAAHLAMNEGAVAEAVDLFQATLKACERVPGGYVPPMWTIKHGLAHCYDSLGRKAEALACAEEASGQRPDLEDARLLAARLRRELDEVNRAKTRPSPAHPQPNPKKMEGLLYLQQQQELRAAECFVEAIDLDPADPENYRYLAYTLKILGREDEAIDAWKMGEEAAGQMNA